MPRLSETDIRWSGAFDEFELNIALPALKIGLTDEAENDGALYLGIRFKRSYKKIYIEGKLRFEFEKISHNEAFLVTGSSTIVCDEEIIRSVEKRFGNRGGYEHKGADIMYRLMRSGYSLIAKLEDKKIWLAFKHPDRKPTTLTFQVPDKVWQHFFI